MATKKFSQFTPGGDLSPTDQIVGLRSGVNYRFSAPTGQLLASNNLSDVDDSSTSLSNIGGQPIQISGVGSPNGVVPGVGGISYYFDTSTFDVWKCDASGDSSWERLISQRDIQIPFIFYVSGTKGNDADGTGSLAFPFQTYTAAASAAFLVASALTPAVVFIMDNITVTGDVTFYPFVYLRSDSPSTGVLRTTGDFLLDTSWDTTTNPVFYSTNVSLISDIGANFTFNVSQNASMILYNSPFTVASSVQVNGSGGANNEIFLNILEISIANPPAFDLKNIIGVFDLANTSRIFMNNEFTSNQSLLICSNASTPGALGDITIKGSAPYPGTVLFSQNCMINSLTIDGPAAIWLTDSTSYTSNVSFLDGASFDSILTLTSSDGINANITFTPVHYVLPTATAYPQRSVTNNLAGIDNAIGALGNPNSYPQVAHANSSTGNDSSTNGNMQSPFLTYDAAISFLQTFLPSATNRCAVVLTGDFTVTDLNWYPFIDVYVLGSATITADNVLNISDWDTISNPSIIVGSLNIVSPNFSPAFTVSQNAKQYYVGTDFTGSSNPTFTGSGTDTPEQIYLTNCVSKDDVSYLFNTLSGKVTNCDAINVTLKNTSSLALDVKCTGLVPQLDTGEGLLFRVDDGTGSSILTSIGCDPTACEIIGTNSRWMTDASSYITPNFSGGADKNSVGLISLSDSLIANENYTATNYTPDNINPNYQGESVTGHLSGINNKIGELISDLDIPIEYLVRFSSGQMIPIVSGYQVVPMTVTTATGTDFTTNLTDGTVTYGGALTKKFNITFNLSVEGSVATNINLAIGVNGTRDILTEQLQSVRGLAQPNIVTISWIETLSTGDFINLTASPIVANTLQLSRGGLIIHSV